MATHRSHQYIALVSELVATQPSARSHCLLLKSVKAWCLALFAVGSALSGCFAQSGFILDQSFQAGIQKGRINGFIPLADGGGIALGQMRLNGTPPGAYRHAIRFDGDGEPLWVWTGAYPGHSATNVSIDALGRIYAVVRNEVHRFNENGYDTAFQGIQDDRIVVLDISFLALFDGGRMLLSGSFEINDAALDLSGIYRHVWLDGSGFLDTTRMPKRSGGMNMTQWPFGGFLCSTWWESVYDGDTVPSFFRIDDDGAYLGEFNCPLETGSVFGSIKAGQDGSLLASGRFRVSGASETTCVLRMTESGALDPSFQRPTFTDTTSWFARPMVREVLSMPDGSILVPGSFDLIDGEPRVVIAALNADGTLSGSMFSDVSCHYQIDTLGYGGPYMRQRWGASMVHGSADMYYLFGIFSDYRDGTSALEGYNSLVRLVDLTARIEERYPTPFVLRPNPTTGVSIVEFKGPIGRREVQLLNAIGMELSRTVVTSDPLMIDLSGMAPGVYIVVLLDQDGGRAAQRLVLE